MPAIGAVRIRSRRRARAAVLPRPARHATKAVRASPRRSAVTPSGQLHEPAINPVEPPSSIAPSSSLASRPSSSWSMHATESASQLLHRRTDSHDRMDHATGCQPEVDEKLPIRPPPSTGATRSRTPDCTGPRPPGPNGFPSGGASKRPPLEDARVNQALTFTGPICLGWSMRSWDSVPELFGGRTESHDRMDRGRECRHGVDERSMGQAALEDSVRVNQALTFTGSICPGWSMRSWDSVSGHSRGWGESQDCMDQPTDAAGQQWVDERWTGRPALEGRHDRDRSFVRAGATVGGSVGSHEPTAPSGQDCRFGVAAARSSLRRPRSSLRRPRSSLRPHGDRAGSPHRCWPIGPPVTSWGLGWAAGFGNSWRWGRGVAVGRDGR